IPDHSIRSRVQQPWPDTLGFRAMGEAPEISPEMPPVPPATHASGSIPSLLGTYLAASTAFAAFYNRSPVGNSYMAGVEPSTASFLQTVAWETVQKYYGRDTTN
ncbi:MAG TPA: hypothetical protein VFR21_25530, partial [Bradyrhizobium sp.]|nr:hypothetical protein [Bradyrhizobium sp.]